jgi:hypothetical protein
MAQICYCGLRADDIEMVMSVESALFCIFHIDTAGYIHMMPSFATFAFLPFFLHIFADIDIAASMISRHSVDYFDISFSFLLSAVSFLTVYCR